MLLSEPVLSPPVPPPEPVEASVLVEPSAVVSVVVVVVVVVVVLVEGRSGAPESASLAGEELAPWSASIAAPPQAVEHRVQASRRRPDWRGKDGGLSRR